MKFFDDVLKKSSIRTCTSLPSNLQNNEEYENMLAEACESPMLVLQPTCSSVSNSSSSEENNINLSKKRKLDKMDDEFHETIIAALQKTNKQPDAVDGCFLMLLGKGLRELPCRDRTKLEMKFLAMLTEE